VLPEFQDRHMTDYQVLLESQGRRTADQQVDKKYMDQHSRQVDMGHKNQDTDNHMVNRNRNTDKRSTGMLPMEIMEI